ncbi:hypothetical protein JTB14_020914 [Gonioctena quinquepunctata]|nr:hypothetical protein JTB14_020914 [Gonioctena quinquepunctata]
MSCKEYLTVKELEAALEDALDDLERASKRQGPPTTKQDSNISDVPDREGEQSDPSDEETLASKLARLNQSIPNHADNVPQWARGEIEYTNSPMDNEKKNEEHLEAELSGKTPLEIFRLSFDDERSAGLKASLHSCSQRSAGLKSDVRSSLAVLIGGFLERSLVLSRSARSRCMGSWGLSWILSNSRTKADLRRRSGGGM